MLASLIDKVCTRNAMITQSIHTDILFLHSKVLRRLLRLLRQFLRSDIREVDKKQLPVAGAPSLPAAAGGSYVASPHQR